MKKDQDRTAITLIRALGLPSGILLVAGTMIGSGAFKKIAPMSQALMSEPYILMAWIVAGVITMFGAFTYAGLSGMTTATGGVYEYLRLIYGDFVAFLFGWTFFTIAGSGAIAALAFVFSQSANTLFLFPDPLNELSNVSIGNFIFPFASSGIKILAILMISMLTWLNCLGIKNGGVLNNIITSAKIGGILILIVAGLLFSGSVGDDTNTTLTTDQVSGITLFSGFFGAMLSALWAYDGWFNITFVTGEIKNPQRNIPLAIIGGVAVAMTLYVLLNYVYMKVLPLTALAAIRQDEIAAAVVAGRLLGDAGTVIIAVLILVCTFGALNACILAFPRIYYRMAQEKVFFNNAAFVHPTFRTPYLAIIYSSVWSCILVITGTFDQLTNLVIFSNYFFFGLATWGLIMMKRKRVIQTKVIGYPVIPLIIILFTLALVINTIIVQPKESLIGICLVFSGVPFYFYFKRKIN